MQRAVKFYNFDKIAESHQIVKQAEIRWASAAVEYAELSALEALDSAQESDLKSAEFLKDYYPDVSDAAMFTAQQSGGIAQELQELCKEIGDFEWLIVKVEKDNPDSTLAVDYESLAAIRHCATNELLNRLEAAMA
ncbi:hypothetical protein [Crenothrix sp.]|uniref:hypothetical protein n=1 Tax=Crenothrix sp. TaxID=3100433 RepID=UPI00374D0A1A